MSEFPHEEAREARYCLAEKPTEDDILVTRALMHCTYGGESTYGSDGVSAFDRQSSDAIAHLMKLPDEWREGEEISFLFIEPEQDIGGLVDSEVDLATFSVEVLDGPTGGHRTEIQHHIADFGGPMTEQPGAIATAVTGEGPGESQIDDSDPETLKRLGCEGRTHDSWLDRGVSPSDHPEDGDVVE